MKNILLTVILCTAALLADFTRDAANGIVTDNTTTLMWQDDAVGTTTTWQGAIDRCEALELGGHTDWRLPNLNELTSIADDSRWDSSIYPVFQNIGLSYWSSYWSSTTDATDFSKAWYVEFIKGRHGSDQNKSDNIHYVRCVRAGE